MNPAPAPLAPIVAGPSGCWAATRRGRACRRPVGAALVAPDGEIARFCLGHLRRGVSFAEPDRFAGSALVPDAILAVIASCRPALRHALAREVAIAFSVPLPHPFAGVGFESPCGFCGKELSFHL